MKEIDEVINKVKTINELDALQNEINEAFETRRRVLNLVSEANSIGDKSFGYIKESFENLSPVLFKSPEGKSLMRRYADLIKSNKSLSSLHKLYENIRKAHSGIDVDFFVGSLCETDWNINREELNEGLAKLGDIVAEGYITVGEGAAKYLGNVNDVLDRAVEFIAENKAGKGNLVRYSEAVRIIREAVEKNGNIADSFANDGDLDKTVEALIKKYNSDAALEDSRPQAENDIARGGDEEDVFNTKKESCMENIKKAIGKYEADGQSEEVDTLRRIEEQISVKKYNPDTIGPDICNFIEMSKLFE